jgi:hypothetical protein
MSCKPLTFRNIDRDKFRRVRARIRAQAEVSVKGDSGIATNDGMSANFSYDEAAQTLTIQCIEKPVYFSEALIADKITALVGTA